ncbi:MAG: D-alanyl-D-alaninecarboxypeptidase/D-alanyl-D-alanine-endopeptidase [Solirubrobacterales bacterium]|nr:D-alanyl-D-alaninecarboxypeptidase/D-alanyl-D-alanine-endopeptidase [Solirubrobacterales bacterium]
MFRRRLIPALLLAVLLVLPSSASALAPAKLTAALNAQMRQAGSSSAAYVMELNGDDVLYSLRPDQALMPASVNKLFTTATALRRFGAAGTLDTSVVADGEIDAGVLNGDLYLKGAGDPTLTSIRVAALADKLDITRVKGKVLGDESILDALRGSAVTGGRLDPEIGGQLGGLVTARGYAGSGWQKRPAAVAADALRSALVKRGIKVSGKAGVGVAPQDAPELATSASPTISEIIQRTNVPSDNYYAETLLKDLGAAYGDGGSTKAGAQVVEDEMADLDVRPTIVDGSGLSRGDRTNVRQVVTLLAAMAGGEDSSAYLGSLAVVGRSGTLQYRMRSTPARDRCRGKTGTLHDVSNLAGICTTASGKQVAFAILMNYVNPSSAHVLQDRMVAAIARVG